MRQSWRELRRGEPGQRFQERYHRNRGADTGAGRWLRLGAGAVLLVLGLLMLVTPGPGLVALAVGAALLAGEFRAIARFLDWAELRVHRLAARR